MAPKIKLNKTRFRKGDIIELTKDVGPIPSGRYELGGKEDGFYIFGILETAMFGISYNGKKYLKKLSSTDAIELTTAAEFITRYYALLATESGTPYSSDKPLTFCAVDPRALKYLSGQGSNSVQMH